MLVQTETLSGASLIWAVCKALRQAPVIAVTGIAYRSDHGSWVYPRYTDDSEAGLLMASELIGAERPSQGQSGWLAVANSKLPSDSTHASGLEVNARGDSLAEAVCRALVMSRIGGDIDVPEELLLSGAS